MSFRTSLQRLTWRDPAAPSLRERLASATTNLSATKERARTAAKVARALMASPEPAPELPNRVALINYATWLWHERRRVCGELYPHLGTKGNNFVLGLNAGEDWHFKGRDRSGGWAEKPPATPRAIQILDAVGVDWRADIPNGGLSHVDGQHDQDDGTRPKLPHGWPAPDAALLEALDDLTRLDAAQAAMGNGMDRESDQVPGYDALEAARDGALTRLAKVRAESLTGLQAKARALMTRSVSDMGGADFENIAESLARDLTGASQRMIEPRPDPIFAAIEEGRRFLAVAAEASKLPDVGLDPHPDREAAMNATWAHFRGPISTTVPTTARGCVALARYTAEFAAFQEVDLGDELPSILANIARSPLL